jgi:hypothetical protein
MMAAQGMTLRSGIVALVIGRATTLGEHSSSMMFWMPLRTERIRRG